MIVAVVVAYNPDTETYVDLLKRLAPQVDRICIVDNSASENDSAFRLACSANVDLERLSLLRLGENLGIARALNLGIEMAASEGANLVLLSDQDSLPAENMVEGLVSALNALHDRGENAGAVGPTYTDLNTGLTYPFQAAIPSRLFYGHRTASPNAPHVEALTLITSGTLIPVSVFKKVGPMREDFFIDQVDIEWCHRARARGYCLFGTAWAQMYQRMGERRLRVWYLRWRFESAYDPLRIYYRIRNFTALWKLDFIDWRWKVRSSWYSVGIVYAHVLFGHQRLRSLAMSARGVWHGLSGRMGRYPA
jgi:rhamnosyltransferase